MDEILTKQDIADHQKVSKRTVERWMKDRGLPFYKIGNGKVRFKREDYLLWLNKMEKQCQSTAYESKTVMDYIKENKKR